MTYVVSRSFIIVGVQFEQPTTQPAQMFPAPFMTHNLGNSSPVSPLSFHHSGCVQEWVFAVKKGLQKVLYSIIVNRLL